MNSAKTLPSRLLVATALLLSLAGFANQGWEQVATILLFVLGTPVLAYFAYKSGTANPKALILLMASTNASVWLSIWFWHLRQKMFASSPGIDPYAGVAAFWFLAFLVLALYELIALLNSLRNPEQRVPAMGGVLVFILQLGTIHHIWALVSGV